MWECQDVQTYENPPCMGLALALQLPIAPYATWLSCMLRRCVRLGQGLPSCFVEIPRLALDQVCDESPIPHLPAVVFRHSVLGSCSFLSLSRSFSMPSQVGV